MFIVSRCLLGDNCKYNGENNANKEVIEFCKTHKYVAICPESAADLDVPREPVELKVSDTGEIRAIDRLGNDLTEDFNKGAYWSIQAALLEAGSRADGAFRIEGAILKDNSPSCGAGTVYDGTFTGNLIERNGIFTDKLIEAYKNDGQILGRIDFTENFRICNEHNFKEVFK